MTMSFAEQVRAAVAKAESAAKSESAQRFVAVLDELKAGLEGLGVGARLQPGKDPRKLTLYLHPQHRPGRANLMLTFFLDGEGVNVVGEGSTSLKTPEELQQWLLRYVQMPTFVESVRTLREEAERPVEARLRVDSGASHAAGDVVVAVSPEDQEQLHVAEKGAPLELRVERIAFPGNGQLDEGRQYALLESAGLFLTVTEVEAQGNTFMIKGERAA